MTIVAWDGHTLAADTMGQRMGAAVIVQKIFYLDSMCLVGIAGSLDRGLLVVEWIKAGMMPSSFPDAQSVEDTCVDTLIIRKMPDGTVRVSTLGHTCVEIPTGVAKFAIGSGAQFALGVMAMGGTAEQAVVRAALWLPTIRGLQTMRFDQARDA
jgi:hypothetical protein